MGSFSARFLRLRWLSRINTLHYFLRNIWCVGTCKVFKLEPLLLPLTFESLNLLGYTVHLRHSSEVPFFSGDIGARYIWMESIGVLFSWWFTLFRVFCVIVVRSHQSARPKNNGVNHNSGELLRSRNWQHPVQQGLPVIGRDSYSSWRIVRVSTCVRQGNYRVLLSKISFLPITGKSTNLFV